MKRLRQLVIPFIPLFNPRIASLIMILKEKNNPEAEKYYDEQAQEIELMRSDLIGLLKNNNVVF